MTETLNEKDAPIPEEDRRSSVRVRSLLPCALRVVSEEEIPELEARILDMAVIESEGSLIETSDWSERNEELPRELSLVLGELRALRQQVTELQRVVERQSEGALEPRWITINDRGFRAELGDDELDVSVGEFVEIRVRIPNLRNPDILAIGEVVRIDDLDEGHAAAVEFRAISQLHKKAIIRYALRRERQLARSGDYPTARGN